MDRKVAAQQIPAEQWKVSLLQAGFPSHAAEHIELLLNWELY